MALAGTIVVTGLLSDSAYLRERSAPRPGENLYLHLSDLARALRGTSPPGPGSKMLDFGSGGSPYRELFGAVNYRRADFEPSPGIDYPIAGDGTTTAPSGAFDMVLSTQVLEHVANVELYLSECARLLRAGGTLVISTHGTFEDHPCPRDFRRWTAEGIREDLERSGFEVVRVSKLTTDARALAFLLRTRIGSLSAGRHGPFGFAFWLLAKALQLFPRRFDLWCDRHFAGARVVEARAPGHKLYVGLLAVAVKPA